MIMKISKLIPAFGLFLFLGQSCGNKSEIADNKLAMSGASATFELVEVGNAVFKDGVKRFDTVNLVDQKGLKQGKWIPSKYNDLKEVQYYKDGNLQKN
jgi:hypothetical protein